MYLSAWGDHKDRKIGEVKEDGPEAAVSYFQEKFKDFSGKIQGLVDTIEAAENKGSYLMKLLHLKEQVAVHEGLGDYLGLEKIIVENEILLGNIISQNRERNTEIKNALMIEAREAVEIVNWQLSTEKLQDVKARWLKTGNAREDVQDQLEEEFWGIVEAYFARKKAFYEDKKRLTDLRKEKYENILKEADGLANLRGKDRFDKVKELKAAWEAVGNIPAKEYKPLQFRFNGVLKGRRELPPPDFSSMKRELDRMFSKEISVDKDMLQRYRKSLGSFKTREPQMKEKRHETMQLINVIWERDFLEGLAGKKHKGFATLPQGEQSGIMVKLLREFLRRDLEDLKQYEENTEKFAGHDQNTNRMLERKLGQQRNKITVKQKLLEILEEKAG